MPALAPLNAHMQQLVDEHRQWLSTFHPQYLANWDRLFNDDDESAMTEAVVRRILEHYGVTVEPNEDLTGAVQSPDFRCVKANSQFYVEVTRISVAKATDKTGIDDVQTGLSGFRPLNDAIFEVCRGKARQCGSADGPVLLAVGTWHGFAAMASFQKPIVNMLLTGETKMTWNLDITTGQQVGDTYQTTELYSAAFLRPDPTQDVGFARSSISGLLLIANGLLNFTPLGVLHPNPTHAFDSSVLPDIEFGAVEVDRESGHLRVRWSGGNDE